MLAPLITLSVYSSASLPGSSVRITRTKRDEVFEILAFTTLMTTYAFRLFDLSGNLLENEFRDNRNQIAYIIRPVPQPKLSFAFPELPSPVEIVRQPDWGIALEHEPWRAVLTLSDNETLQVRF